jgi:hypothetical protein
MRRVMVATAGIAAIATAAVIATADEESGRTPAVSPIFGVAIPADYRLWPLVSVAEEQGFDELRGVLGNATAVRAYAEGRIPFPDGSVLVKLAWKRAPLAGATGGLHGAFVAGEATTVQVMVKDSQRYAATGGWGFGRFVDGKPADTAQHESCFTCHEANAKPGRDYVFTEWGR